MAKKLISIDLDGTIIFDRAVDQEAIVAIKQWQEAGNIAVCNTGKSIAATKHALRDTDLEFDYYVLYTGAVVTDRNYHVLMSHTLPNQLVTEVVTKLQGRPNLAVYVTTLDTSDVQLSNTIDPSLSTDILQSFDPMPLEDIPNHTFVGIPLWLDLPDAEIEHLHKWILDNYGNQIDCHRNQYFLDIVPPNCTKATGMTWLMNQLPEKYETYSLGDSWNDLDMHQWADHAASFTYSPPAVQAATETVTDTAANYIRKVLV